MRMFHQWTLASHFDHLDHEVIYRHTRRAGNAGGGDLERLALASVHWGAGVPNVPCLDILMNQLVIAITGGRSFP